MQPSSFKPKTPSALNPILVTRIEPYTLKANCLKSRVLKLIEDNTVACSETFTHPSVLGLKVTILKREDTNIVGTKPLLVHGLNYP